MRSIIIHYLKREGETGFFKKKYCSWFQKFIPDVISLFAENSSSPYRGSDLKDGGGGLWSGVTEEGLDLTQFLTEHGFAGIEIENEELVLNVSSRLQAAVEKLLEAINETTNQVMLHNYILGGLQLRLRRNAVPLFYLKSQLSLQWYQPGQAWLLLTNPMYVIFKPKFFQAELSKDLGGWRGWF